MSPYQFETWLESTIKEFDELYLKLVEQSPNRAQTFFDKARAYENVLVEFKKIDKFHR